VKANLIAKWNGNVWSTVGSGISGQNSLVNALAVSVTNVYVGGYFTTAGGVKANHVAKWNGSAWSALGSGIDGQNPSVHALAVSGTDLYAGGYFTTAGGIPATNIAKWNGSAWSALGSGMGGVASPSVDALAVSGTNLYAGGYFTAAGGVTAKYIARWDGSVWSVLGSGLNSSVSALATDGSGRLFVGGTFYLAGTNVSPFIAQANIGAGIAPGRFVNLLYSPTTGFSCTFGDATVGQPYRIQTSCSPAADSWTELTNFTYTGPIVLSDGPGVPPSNKLYRAVSP
jgi:hypothetical protein